MFDAGSINLRPLDKFFISSHIINQNISAKWKSKKTNYKPSFKLYSEKFFGEFIL